MARENHKTLLAVEGVPLEPAWFQGGVSLYLREILSGFSRDNQFGFHVFAKALAPGAREFLADHHIPFTMVRGGSVVWRKLALQALGEQNHIAGAWFPFHTVGPRCPVPFAFTVHDFSFLRPWVSGSLWHRIYYFGSFWFAARSAQSILCVSQATFGDLSRYFPFWKAKARVAPHGVPADVLALAPAAKTNHQPPRALFLDAGNPRKRFDLFIRAMNQPEFRSWNLQATGDPSSIQAYLRARGIPSPQNLLLPGKLSRADLLSRIGAADVVAYLSDFEGFGFPILEALALGTPVVCFPGRAEKEVGREWACYANRKNPCSVAAAVSHALAQKRSEKMARIFSEVRPAFGWQRSFAEHRAAWGVLAPK
jgi:glycosyltransferase involved in cell wall biosynthesis